MTRFLFGWALVVALLASVSAGCASSARVPPGLVGLWRGGSHTNGPWFYEFTAEGVYRAWPERSPDVVTVGTVVVDDAVVTFSNAGAPVTSTWSLSNGTLVLDGQSYVRAEQVSPATVVRAS